MFVWFYLMFFRAFAACSGLVVTNVALFYDIGLWCVFHIDLYVWHVIAKLHITFMLVAVVAVVEPFNKSLQLYYYYYYQLSDLGCGPRHEHKKHKNVWACFSRHATVYFTHLGSRLTQCESAHCGPECPDVVMALSRNCVTVFWSGPLN
jgi:hypothetical protein